MSFDLEVGSQFSEYRIESILGRGGMSVVYLAEHLPLQRKVALKVLAPELAGDQDFRTRFVRESQVAASIDHPNIIPIYAAGEVGGVLFIAMRYVDGTDLKQLIEREGPLAPDRTIALLAQVASALDAAHARGLVHRDVKPANVLVAPGAGPRGTDHCYLSDFGLTKQALSKTGLTQAGHFVGTLDYIAPEQIQGKPLDGRADVYALGCVLYECLAGRRPFRKDSDVAVIYAHLQEPPPAVSLARPGLPPGLDRVVATALAKEPAGRYSTCTELVQAAERELQTGVGVRSRPAGEVDRTRLSPDATVERTREGPLPTAPATWQPPPPPVPTPSTTPAPDGFRRPSRTPVWIGLGVVVAVVAVVAALVLGSHKGTTATTGPVGTGTPTPSSSLVTPSGTNLPDARDVPLATILRPGTLADRVLYADLNGDGIKEIILSSHAKARTAIGGQQPFLDVWSFTGQGFQRVFDATLPKPPGVTGPDQLISSSQDVSSQQVSWLDIVDFQSDGTPELVTGITSFGAGVGPMDVWVISMRGSGFHADFDEQTTQGGTLTRDGDTEKLETPFFRPNDPLCCPTKIEHQVIAFSAADQKIEVVSTTFTKP